MDVTLLPRRERGRSPAAQRAPTPMPGSMRLVGSGSGGEGAAGHFSCLSATAAWVSLCGEYNESVQLAGPSWTCELGFSCKPAKEERQPPARLAWEGGPPGGHFGSLPPHPSAADLPQQTPGTHPTPLQLAALPQRLLTLPAPGTWLLLRLRGSSFVLVAAVPGQRPEGLRMTPSWLGEGTVFAPPRILRLGQPAPPAPVPLQALLPTPSLLSAPGSC